jgi:hypothetical protein
MTVAIPGEIGHRSFQDHGRIGVMGDPALPAAPTFFGIAFNSSPGFVRASHALDALHALDRAVTLLALPTLRRHALRQLSGSMHVAQRAESAVDASVGLFGVSTRTRGR